MTAEEVLRQVKGDLAFINDTEILEAMKAYAQQEREQAVEVALRVASERGKINIWRNYPKVHDLDVINLTSHSEIGKDVIRVSKQSILSLAPQIIEELNNGK